MPLPDDNEPITESWLLSQGFKVTPNPYDSNYTDHLEKDGLSLWEFNDTGAWLWDDYSHVEMRTRGHLRLLTQWLGWTEK